MTYYLRGQVSKAANLNIEVLRFYEKKGLIPIPERTQGGYRIYTENTLDRLEFIKRAKDSGFTLDEIKHLFSILDSKIVDQKYISEILVKKVEDIDQKINKYNRMKEFLFKVKDNMHRSEKCPVLRSLMKDL